MDVSQFFNTSLEDPSASYKFLDPGYWFDSIVSVVQGVFQITFSQELTSLIKGVATFLAIFFITIILYSAVRMFEIRRKEHDHLAHEIAEFAHHQKEKEKKLREGEGVSKNLRWVQVLEYLASHNVNDWKLAIIEADSMLDSLMTDLKFEGENLGEKLKSADRDKFRNLTTAWEAHTVRNKIAHEGASFDLSLHEARRVVALYEQIFREFGYI
ncbi:hypothetical protein K8Q98_01055 [Candidatus Nomurabacteria bacterium]|nr:hypothetical protein [Candidatus Nomurabacteria bacterium]